MPRAKRRCGKCDNVMPCATHSRPAWDRSTRTRELPSNWSSIRADILARDMNCQIAYTGTWWTNAGKTSCAAVSVEVDHVGDKLDHSPANLRGACIPCHRRRTADQAREAQSKKTLI